MPLPKITWNVDPVLFSIPTPDGSGIGVRTYTLLFLAALIAGYALLDWQVRRGGGREEDAGDFVVYGLVGVMGGARLGHVFFYELDKARSSPAWILQIWTGGLSSHGAAIGICLAMFVFTRRRRVPFLEGFDRFAYSAALGATLVRLGNFMNSEVVGRRTDQSWGVRFPRFIGDQAAKSFPYRHPSQLYEVALGLAVLGAVFLADRAWGREQRPRGALISLAALVYFTGRFLVEFVKDFQPGEHASGLTTGQWLSIPGALIGCYGLWWSLRRRLPAGWPATVTIRSPGG